MPRQPFPFVSLIRPVCALEKDLRANLASACRQQYPDYEVIFAIQDTADPAIGVLKEIVGSERQAHARVVVDKSSIGPNGKVSNLYNACRRAKGDFLVFADSDMFLGADYLRKIVAPASERRTGICCTLYQAWRPANIFEALELLSYNTDFIVSLIFAVVTGAALACPGASLAMRRDVLDEIGGWPSLADYYVEDYELGRRVAEKGYGIHFVPYVVKMSLDIHSPGQWWRQQVGWDQKTKAANPLGFFMTLFVRGIPFACLYAASGAAHGVAVLLAALGLRCLTAILNAACLRDRDALRFIWLLPIRDILGVFVWLAALLKKRGCWRDKMFVLKHGRMVEDNR